MLPSHAQDIQTKQCQKKRTASSFWQLHSQIYIDITCTPLILLQLRTIRKTKTKYFKQANSGQIGIVHFFCECPNIWQRPH